LMQPDGSYERVEESKEGELIDIQRWFLNQR